MPTAGAGVSGSWKFPEMHKSTESYAAEMTIGPTVAAEELGRLGFLMPSKSTLKVELRDRGALRTIWMEVGEAWPQLWKPERPVSLAHSSEAGSVKSTGKVSVIFVSFGRSASGVISTLYRVLTPAVVTSGVMVKVSPVGGTAAVIVRTLGSTAETSVLPLGFTAVTANPVTAPTLAGFLIPETVIVREVTGSWAGIAETTTVPSATAH